MNKKKLKLICFTTIVIFSMVDLSLAKSDGFSVGIFGGGAWSATSKAMNEYPNTKFKSSMVFGGSIMYKFHSPSAFELSIIRLGMDIDEFGTNFGTLNMNIMMLSYKHIGLPTKETGFMGYLTAGLGMCSSRFNKGSFITDLEKIYSTKFDIYTDNYYAFALGGGFGYFFKKNISINLDTKILVTWQDTAWKMSEPGGSEIIFLVDTFNPGHFQIILGVRYWFR